MNYIDSGKRFMDERRTIERISKILDVIVSSESIKEGMDETLATCKNISIGGVCLELSDSYRKGEQLFLRLFSNRSDEFIDTQCEVVWIKNLEEDSLFSIGLKFHTMNEAQFEKLIQF